MTRINFGVEPGDLCNEHLIAEYKELPRAFAFVGRTLDGPYRLGTGHVIWCSQFHGSLATRYLSLVDEMRYRGFEVNFPTPRGDGAHATPEQLLQAGEIVTARILERLADMKREPTWTRRSPPVWALPALRLRNASNRAILLAS